MSGESGGVSGSWLPNGTYPASDDRASETAVYDSERPAELPLPEERLAGLMERHREKMLQPVSVEHGRKVREEALAEPEVDMVEYEVGNGEAVTVENTVERETVPLIQVVEELLRWYEGYRDKYLRMVRGNGYSEEREAFLVELDNSFEPGYQEGTLAKLKGLQRQTVGGEYPDGFEAEGEFIQPVTVMMSLTASGVSADGTPRPVVDHERGIREAWSGSRSSVKRTLRYVLEDKLGLNPEDYVWWFQTEPHPGDGPNAGYAHAHPVVILDLAEASVGSVSAEMFRPVIAKHVAECPGAEWSGHGLDDAVEVKLPEEIGDWASYVAEYVAVDTETDLLERSDEHLIYAAAMWASTSQKYSKSGTATAAVEVDKCHQQYFDDEARQDFDHGEEVRRGDGEIVCKGCGESFGVNQYQTLTEARLSGVGGSEGGEGESMGEASAGWNEECGRFESDSVAVRWSSARSAGAVGGETVERECGHPEGSAECPLCCPEGERVDASIPIPEDAEPAEPVEYEVEGTGERKPATWEPEAIVQVWSGEETVVGSPGGTVYGEVVVGGAGSIEGRLDGRTLLPEWLKGPEPWEGSPVEEGEVRSGELPPPELVEREYAEALAADRRVTAKEWPDDWYARRYEREEESGGESIDERVREFVEREEPESVARVMGRFRLSPECRSAVEELVG